MRGTPHNFRRKGTHLLSRSSIQNTALAAVLLTALWTPAFATEPVTATLPEFLWSSDAGRDLPVWVRADAAVTPDGSVDLSLFSDATGWALNHNLQDVSLRDTNGCTQLEEYYESIPNRTDFSTLEKLISKAPSVILGTVAASSFGFSYGTPGQGFELKIDEEIGTATGRDHVYVFFPVGSFHLGKYKICKTDSRYARPPQLGDQVLFFLDPLANPNDAMPSMTEASSLLVIGQDGTARYPSKLVKGTSVNTDSEHLLSAVRNARRQDFK